MGKFGGLELLILLFLVGVLFIPFIYLSQLQRIIKLTKVENRFIKPSSVWLAIIPIVGVFVHYHHVLEIDNTLKKEFKCRNINIDSSQFGLISGKIFNIANIVSFFLNIFYVIYFNFSLKELQNSFNNNYPYSSFSEASAFEEIFSSKITLVVGLLILLISMLGLINWIIYWSKISIIKKKLSNFVEIKKYNSENSVTSFNEFCPNCNTKLKEGDKFCIACGLNVQDYIQSKKLIIKSMLNNKCTSCNNLLHLSDKFCTKCGTKVEEKNTLQNDNCPECYNDRVNNEDTCLKCGFPFNDNLTHKSNNNIASFLVKSCPDCNNTRLNNEETCLKCGFPFDDSQNQVSNFENTDYGLKSCPECKNSRNNNEDTCSKCGFPFVEVQIDKDNPQKTQPFADNKLESVKPSNEQLTKNRSFFQKPLFWIIFSLILLSTGIFFFLKNSNEGLNYYADEIIECELLKQELLKEDIQDLSIRLNSNEFNNLEDFNNYIEQQNLKLVSEAINNCETEIKKSIEYKHFSPKEIREIRKLAKNHSKSNLIESLKSNNIKLIGYLSSQAETKFESKKKELISLSEFENQPMDDGYNEDDENNYVENIEESDNDITSNDNQIYSATEQDAEFPGGNPSQFVASRFNPEAAYDIQGKIIVRFVVEKDGSISNIVIVRGLSQESSIEVTRVLQSMPKWKPGKNNGKVVRSQFNLPIVIQ